MRWLKAYCDEACEDGAYCRSCRASLREADRVVWQLGNDGRVLLQENIVVIEFEDGCGITSYPTYDRGLCRRCRGIRIKVGKVKGLGLVGREGELPNQDSLVNEPQGDGSPVSQVGASSCACDSPGRVFGVDAIRKANCHCDSSSPVGDGCRSLCNPTGEGLSREERYQLIGACICLISALQGQGSVSGSGGIRDGFDRYAQHRDLIGKVTKHLALGGQLSPVAREFLTRDLAYLIGEISLQSFDVFQRIFDGIQFIHDSSSPVGDETLSFPSDPTGEGSPSGSDEGVE